MSQLKEVYKTGRRMRNTAVVDDDFPEMMHYFDSALHAVDRLPPIPKIICLCGSTRFYATFQKANYDLTMQGAVVLSVGFYRPSVESEAERQRYEHHGENIGCTPEQKIALDELHKRKIDLADEILVLNVGGYIGDSTRSEIEYAIRTGKPVKYLEN